MIGPSAILAASCSAAFFVRPVPSPTTSPATLAVTAVDALKRNKAVMTPSVVDPRAEQKFRPGGGAATTEMTTTEESGMHPVLKWTLIAGGTAVGVYGVYYVARRYGLI